jgi:hypothetical protein
MALDKRFSDFTDYTSALITSGVFFVGYDPALPVGTRNIRASWDELVSAIRTATLAVGSQIIGIEPLSVLHVDSLGAITTNDQFLFQNNQLIVPFGSVGNPGYSFFGNLGTGLLRSADTDIERLQASVDGNEVLQIERDTMAGSNRYMFNTTTWDNASTFVFKGATSQNILNLYDSIGNDSFRITSTGRVFARTDRTTFVGPNVRVFEFLAQRNATNAEGIIYETNGNVYFGGLGTNITRFHTGDPSLPRIETEVFRANKVNGSAVVIFKLKPSAAGDRPLGLFDFQLVPPDSDIWVSGSDQITQVRVATVTLTFNPNAGNPGYASFASLIVLRPTAGSGNIDNFLAAPTIDQKTGSTSPIFGFHYNPTVTSIIGVHHGLAIRAGNVSLFGLATDYGGGSRVMWVGNRTTTPTSNPTNAFLLWSESGSMRIRQSSGAIWNFTQQAANPDTSGATLSELETEVNELKATLRTIGLIAT